ncbi:hypothetical protein [Streptomyces formicae]|uniref:Uncharacterized protein n=1 Tax=Streptomyces formicae TaxID=1616117 RepID=A0A291Q452_9ACTN|nr:hypothetical protein [Streptomyces formicae]ATL26276.1 hypothetical protein KY5_1258 [Streptomyces formicae]
MSSGQKTMTAFVTVILGLILVILGLSASWPPWAWPATAALLLVIALVTHRVLDQGSDSPPPYFPPDPDEPLPSPQRQEQRVAYVALPSSVADYDFSFSATVRWALLEAPDDAPYINPAGLAIDAVLQRARAVTAQQPPHQAAFVQHQLDGALGTMRPDATGRILAMALDVSLHLSDIDRDRLAKLSNVRKDEDVWEHERNYERSKRAYLGDDVLKDPGSAVVWWLARNDEKVEGAVDRIGLLARLSAAANNERVAPAFEHLAAPTMPAFAASASEGGPRSTPTWEPLGFSALPDDEAADEARESPLDSLLAWFGFSADDEDLELFAERVIDLARAHGKADVIDEVKRRFQPTRPDSDDASPPEYAP